MNNANERFQQQLLQLLDGGLTNKQAKDLLKMCEAIDVANQPFESKNADWAARMNLVDFFRKFDYCFEEPGREKHKAAFEFIHRNWRIDPVRLVA